MYNQQIQMNQNLAMANMTHLNTTGLPIVGMPGGILNNMFFYHGNPMGLQARLE